MTLIAKYVSAVVISTAAFYVDKNAKLAHSDCFTRIMPGSSHDGLAQLAARQIVALEVMGSNPISVTKTFCGV